MKIQLKREQYEDMVNHAKNTLPNEACGLIAGRIKGEGKVVEAVYLLRNVDESHDHFSLDPKEQLVAVKDMRTRGMIPLGNFHSHPQTPARPSEEDVRLAYDKNASYLILSLAQETPVLKSFHIEDGRVTPEPVEIVG